MGSFIAYPAFLELPDDDSRNIELEKFIQTQLKIEFGDLYVFLCTYNTDKGKNNAINIALGKLKPVYNNEIEYFIQFLRSYSKNKYRLICLQYIHHLLRDISGKYIHDIRNIFTLPNETLTNILPKASLYKFHINNISDNESIKLKQEPDQTLINIKNLSDEFIKSKVEPNISFIQLKWNFLITETYESVNSKCLPSLHCIICLDNIKNWLVKPCNHVCFCNYCVTQKIINCPICTTKIISTEKIFF
jgi:hypothetical protein